MSHIDHALRVQRHVTYEFNHATVTVMPKRCPSRLCCTTHSSPDFQQSLKIVKNVSTFMHQLRRDESSLARNVDNSQASSLGKQTCAFRMMRLFRLPLGMLSEQDWRSGREAQYHAEFKTLTTTVRGFGPYDNWIGGYDDAAPARDTVAALHECFFTPLFFARS